MKQPNIGLNRRPSKAEDGQPQVTMKWSSRTGTKLRYALFFKRYTGDEVLVLDSYDEFVNKVISSKVRVLSLWKIKC